MARLTAGDRLGCGRLALSPLPVYASLRPVESSLVTFTAAWMQCAALKVLNRSPVRPSRIPLAFPRCSVETGGSSIVSLYAEVFCQQLYASPKPLVGAHPRIVDAGGHLGLASLFFLHRYPGCRLTTIEPNPHIASLLRRTLAPYASRVTVHEAALSTAEGTTEFHITTDNPLNVTGGLENREAPERGVTRLTVKMLDARKVLAEPVDLMKLDVEGHEFTLLPLPLFEPTHIRNLVIEFHDVHQHTERFQALMRLLVEERGYRVASAAGSALTMADVQVLTGSPVLKLY